MKKTFTILIAAIAALLMMTQPAEVLGQTKTVIASFSRSNSTNSVTGGDFSAAATQKADYYQDGGNVGEKRYVQVLNNSAYWTTTPSSITLTTKIGGGTGGTDLSNNVYAVLLDSKGDEISSSVTFITDHIATNTGDTYSNISISVTNNVYGIRIYHVKENSYNVRYYSFSLSYEAGGGNTPTITLTPDDPGFVLGNVTVNQEIERTFKVTQSNLTEGIELTANIGTLNPTSVNQGAGETTITWTHTPTVTGAISGSITATSGATSQSITISGTAVGPAYEKITSAPQDWSGAYIITGINSNTHYALTGVNNSNLGTATSVTLNSSGNIESNNTNDGYRVIVIPTRIVTANNTTTTYYSLYMEGVGYLAYTNSTTSTSGNNNLWSKSQFESSTCEWTLSYSSNVVLVQNVYNTIRKLQFNYNQGNPRFAGYGGNQTKLNFFKYAGTVVLPVAEPIVTLEAGNGSITPTWNNVPHAINYTLQYGTTNNFTENTFWEVENAESGTGITDHIENGTTYYVRVKAFGNGTDYSNSNWSTVKSATPSGATIPQPEINLFEGVSTGTTNQYVDVASFKFTVEDPDNYILYYTLDGTDPTASQTAVTYTYDDEVIIDATKTIKVVATDLTDYSDVTELAVTIVSTTSIATVFSAPDSDTYYYIEGVATYKSGSKNVYLEDENGGILVYKNDNNFANGIEAGNKLIVKGQKETAYSQPRFKNPTILNNDGQTHPLPLSEIDVKDADDYMFRRVKFTQVLVGTTSNNLTAISQTINQTISSVNVYNIPAIENVTEQGYYLKSLTGVVASYNNATQIYVAAANNIEAYEVEAATNDENLGTVAISGYVITATPASGCSYDDPAFDVTVDQGVTCNVTQNGNTFSVVTDGDAIVEIRFATNATPCTVTYHVNGTVTEFADYQTKYQNQAIGNLPTTDAIGELSFMGWSLSDSDIALINNTYEIGSVSTLDLYAVYAVESIKLEEKNLEITISNFSEITTDYTKTYTHEYTEATVEAYGVYNNSNGIQMNSGKGTYIKNTTQMPGYITKFVMTWTASGKNSPTMYANSNSVASTNSTNLGEQSNQQTTHTINIENPSSANYKYFYFDGTTVTGACYMSSFKIYYIQSSTVYSNYCTTVSTQETVLKLDGDGKLTGNEVIPAGTAINLTSQVIIPNGKTLTVNGALGNDNPANLIIEDGGQLICSNSVAATVKKSIDNANAKDPKNHWYTISAPVHTGSNNYVTIGASTTVNLTNNGAYDMFAYDEPTHYWLNQKAHGAPGDDDYSAGFDIMTAGQGYMYRNSGNELSYVGNTTVGPVNIALSYTSTLDVEGLKGFNLIGNPYTHSIAKGSGKAIVNVVNENTEDEKTVLSNGCYVLSNSGTWTPITDGNEIKPNQGVLVETSAAVADFQIQDINYVATPNQDKYNNDNIQFTVANSEYEDVAYAWFGKGYGLTKISHRDLNAPMLYIPQDGHNYAIATMSDDVKVFGLNFKTATMGQYTLSYKADGNFDYLHIIDRLTGKDIDMLLEGQFTFMANKNDSENRFIVKLGYSPDYSEGNNDIFAYQTGSEILVSGSGELQIFDVTGRQVMTTTINGAESISVPAQGVYIFRLVGNEVKTQKIVVR